MYRYAPAFDLPDGVIDPRVESHDVSAAAREELLNIYNLATALDAALIALSRACPFMKVGDERLHTVHYRSDLAWEGVYTHLQPVGGLQPYAASAEELVELQFARYYTWLEAMDKAGVERHLFQKGRQPAKSCLEPPQRYWNCGNATDSNYPEVILAISGL